MEESVWACSHDGKDVNGEPRERDFSHIDRSISSGYRKRLLPDRKRTIWPKAVSRNRAAMLCHGQEGEGQLVAASKHTMLFLSPHESLTCEVEPWKLSNGRREVRMSQSRDGPLRPGWLFRAGGMERRLRVHVDPWTSQSWCNVTLYRKIARTLHGDKAV